jgi:hypothetical protein
MEELLNRLIGGGGLEIFKIFSASAAAKPLGLHL